MARWRKKMKTGSHQMSDGRMIACGEEIEATRHELSSAVDKFDLIEDDEAEMPDEPSVGLRKVETDGGWDVINDESGEKLNDDPLTAEDADEMVKVLGSA